MVPGSVPKNKYFFDKIFKEGLHSIKIHLKCPDCNTYLGTQGTVLNDSFYCQTCNISHDYNTLYAGNSYFLTSSVENQLREMLEESNLWELISKGKKLGKVIDTKNECGEIYSGLSYKKSSLQSFLSSGDNFTMTFSTDGVRVSRSSLFEIWPITVTINELSVHVKSRFLI